jgi:uncharacterized membrane protein
MRKTLEATSLGALAVLAWITCRALYGPDSLPDRIPTHFDFAGRPNGWGSPSGLLLLPAVAVALYLGMTVVARFPSTFNYPVRVTTENRSRLEALALGLIVWLKTELVCLFTGIQWTTVQAARHPGEGLSVLLAMVPVYILVVLGTIAWHFVAMIRAGRAGCGS